MCCTYIKWCKMKILTINGLYFNNVFKQLGNDVLSLGTTQDCDVLLSEFLSQKKIVGYF